MKLVYIEDKKLFVLSCQYSERAIPSKAGFKFSSKSNLWYTQDIFTARKLAKYADKDLQMRFKKYDDYVSNKIEASASANEDIEIPKPDDLEFDYFGYQKAGVKYATPRQYTLIADDMGLGKTIQAIGVINKMEDPKDILIVCPNSMKGVWKKELGTWLTHDLSVTVNSSSEFTRADIMIINYEAFRFSINKNSKGFRDPAKGKYNSTLELFKDLKKIDSFDLLILDESHRIKNYSANTTRNIFKLKSQIGVKKSIFLTGTPIFSRPDEIWTTIKFFEFEDKFMGNKDKFMSYYQNSYFDRRFKRLVMGEPKHLDELQKRLRMNFMIRRTKKQVFKDMPPKIRKIVPIEVDTTKFDKFDYLIQDMHDVSSLSNEDVDVQLSSLRGGHIGELAEMRQIAGEQKLSPCIEYVNELIEAGEKVIIFGHHKKVLRDLREKYPNCAFITGDTPSDERMGEVEKFQNDPECMVFIGNIASAGVGLTLTASSNVVFLELDFVPANMTQAEDRAYRIGQDRTVFIHYLVAQNTLDAYIADMIIRKQDIFDRMVEKERL